MKTARLDQILLGLGYIDEEQLRRALLRQESHGGRLGSHLVQLGFVSEGQLVDALAAQHDLPAIRPTTPDVPEELVQRMPLGAIVDHLVVPLSYDARRRTLTLAVADPGEVNVIDEVKEAFCATTVNIAVAAESILREIATALYEPNAQRSRTEPLTELSDFTDTGSSLTDVAPEGSDPSERSRHVLMVSRASAVKNFLPPIFDEEGRGLRVVTTRKEAETALSETSFDRVLVASDMVEEYAKWMRSRGSAESDVDASVFSSVSALLLDNPIPYTRMVRSLMCALEIVTDDRCRRLGVSPPYKRILEDVRELSRRYGYRSPALDGMAIAAQLLVPATSDVEKPFNDFAATLENAQRIRFPWRIDALLEACRDLYKGSLKPSDSDSFREELHLSAQILALVWYRYTHIAGTHDKEQDGLGVIKKLLRITAGRLASLEVIEVYLRLLSEREAEAGGHQLPQVMIVGDEGSIPRRLLQRISSAGCRTVWTDRLPDARQMVERRPPAALVVSYDSYADDLRKFCRSASLAPRVPIYVTTEANDPTVTLDLLDLGVEDVFVPPHDLDVIAARIGRAVRSQMRGDTDGGRGHFSGTFDAFAFIDLIQTLGQSLRSVKVNLSNSSGASAVVYLHQGRIVHARCGNRRGEPAVYELIGWGDDGRFTVTPETDFPEANIKGSIESILMEGCRRLDESMVR